MPANVRLFRPEDRAAVLRIAADTAFFGAPVEIFMDDRRLMQDVFVAYYTDCEPEHLWVADVDAAVVGYISSSVGGRRAALRQARVAARAGLRFLVGYYRVGRLTWRYLGREASSFAHGEHAHADLHEYPAHLHINLGEAARGLGLGRRLMETCLNQMTTLGIPGIYLNTTSRNAAAVHLYEKLGFQLLAHQPTTLWKPWLPGVEMEDLVYGKRLNV